MKMTELGFTKSSGTRPRSERITFLERFVKTGAVKQTFHMSSLMLSLPPNNPVRAGFSAALKVKLPEGNILPCGTTRLSAWLLWEGKRALFSSTIYEMCIRIAK